MELLPGHTGICTGVSEAVTWLDLHRPQVHNFIHTALAEKKIHKYLEKAEVKVVQQSSTINIEYNHFGGKKNLFYVKQYRMKSTIHYFSSTVDISFRNVVNQRPMWKSCML